MFFLRMVREGEGKREAARDSLFFIVSFKFNTVTIARC